MKESNLANPEVLPPNLIPTFASTPGDKRAKAKEDFTDQVGRDLSSRL